MDFNNQTILSTAEEVGRLPEKGVNILERTRLALLYFQSYLLKTATAGKQRREVVE